MHARCGCRPVPGQNGRPRGTRWLRAFAVLPLLASVLAACGGDEGSGRPTLNWYNFPDDSGALQKAADRCSQASGGRYRISYNKLPRAADGQRQQLVRRLAAEDDSLDILGLDVTWAAEFAEARWIREWTGAAKRQAVAGTLRVPLQTSTWKSKLYAVPYNTNTQLLWYRKDLVPTPPKTWAEMLDMARDLAKQGKPHFVEIQGAQYEGLTVWFNSLINSAGGSILNKDGHRALPRRARRTGRRRSCATLARSPAADPSLSNQMEDQNRLAMESGTAAFEINYPFVYPSMKANNPKLFKDFRWAPYPRRRREPSGAAHHRRHRPGGERLLAPPRAGLRGGPVPAQPGEPAHRGARGRPAAHPARSATTRRRSSRRTPSPSDVLSALESASVRPITRPTRTCRSRSPTRCPRRPGSSRRARSTPSGNRSTMPCDPRV